MIVQEKQIEQVKKWKKIKTNVKEYYCPFYLSIIGGTICEKAFKRCKHNPNKFRILKIEESCYTEPCPCTIYTMQYVISQTNKIIKYGRI